MTEIRWMWLSYFSSAIAAACLATLHDWAMLTVVSFIGCLSSAVLAIENKGRAR